MVVTLRRKLARSCETRDSDCATLREKQEASLALPAADLSSGRCRAPRDAVLRAAMGADVSQQPLPLPEGSVDRGGRP